MVFTSKDMVYDGFSFDGYFRVEAIRRSLIPEVENTTIRVGRFGERFVSSKTAPTRIEVDIRFIEKDREDVTRRKDLVISKLLKTEPKKLKLRDARGFDLAILDGYTEFERFKRTGFSTLTFLNPRGIRYGDWKTTEVVDSIYNVGMLETNPIITIENTKGTIQIDNITTKESMRIVKPLNSTDKLVIGAYADNMEYQKNITRNGVNDMKNLSLDSYFLSLAPGHNKIRLKGVNKAKFEYVEKLL